MKTFNEYVAETTAPIIMDAVRMQKYEKRIRSARIEKRKRTMRSDKSNTCYLLQSKYTQDITKIKHSLTSHAVIYNQL